MIFFLNGYKHSHGLRISELNKINKNQLIDGGFNFLEGPVKIFQSQVGLDW
jgi:hypothetical protein